MKEQYSIIVAKSSDIDCNNWQNTYKDIPAYRLPLIEKIRNDSDKKRSIAAGRILAFAMGTGSIPLDAECAKSDHGKPYFKAYPDFHFNLSHSGDYVAMIYGNSECGIDIQKIKSVNDSLKKRILSEGESLQDASDSSIIKIWSIKEAYIKCIGTGLSLDMRKIKTEARDNIVVDITGTHPALNYKTFNDIEGYSLSVCGRKDFLPDTYTLTDLP